MNRTRTFVAIALAVTAAITLMRASVDARRVQSQIDLVVGKVGWGPSVHDTRLTPNEQITHITLWTIQAAPLLLGAEMAAFDKFSTDLMTNHEVLRS